MMRKLGSLAWAAGILLLAGCVSRGPTIRTPDDLKDPEAVAAAQARQATREAWLSARPDWSFEGRVAVSQGSKGGNGRLDWQQTGPGYVAALSAPITRQSWRLIADEDGARIEGLEGGIRRGPDADLLLREATGWDIPVRTLAAWARGIAENGEASFDVNGQLQALSQSGWDIRYSEWQPMGSDAPPMPRRIEARRGEARVRLIVDRWDFGNPP